MKKFEREYKMAKKIMELIEDGDKEEHLNRCVIKSICDIINTYGCVLGDNQGTVPYQPAPYRSDK